MSVIRVLVVDDSLTVRRHLCDVLAADRDFEVVGEAADGRRAAELCEALRPDVVTLDMMLPEMTGLAATEYIMAHCPTPILIVSASVNRGELFKTYEALAAGALDVMDKPHGGDDAAAWERRFLSTLKLLARIKVITHPRGRRTSRPETLHTHSTPAAASIAAAPPGDGRFRIIAIGASTGGPGAILRILQQLPAAYPIPIAIVLHIGLPFGDKFAEWFDGQVALPVRFAADGQRLEAPGVWLAPPDRHLQIEGHRMRLLDTPERHSCRPSVDALFESVAREFGRAALGCLLTGMGRDGASGLLDLRRAGAATIAQDEATSIVFGMPREAALLGAAERVLPLEGIGPALLAASRQSSVRTGT